MVLVWLMNLYGDLSVKLNSGEIGFFTKNTETIGTEGSLGMPFESQFESTAANTNFGNHLVLLEYMAETTVVLHFWL